MPATEGPTEDITLEEVWKAIKDMKNHKAIGPLGISSDMIKLAGDTGALELHKVFKKNYSRGNLSSGVEEKQNYCSV